MKKLITVLLLLSPAAAFAAAPAAPPRNYFLEYYVFQLAGLMACLTFLSESAVRRGALSAARARSGWNWLLLVSFTACVLAGFVLFLPLDKPLARLLFKLHVWTGVACGWAGLYHAARRARAM